MPLRFIVDSNSEVLGSSHTTNVPNVLSKYEYITNLIGQKLVFLILPHSFLGCELYINFISSDSIPLFLSEDIGSESFAAIVSSYEPEFIICPENFKPINNEYEFIDNISDLKLYRLSRQKNLSYSNDICVLASTSGSTGSPKLVAQTFDNILTNTQQIVKSLRIKNSSIAFLSLPLSYTFGMSVLNCQLYANANAVVSDSSLISRETLKLILQSQVTLLPGVPATFEQLLAFRFFSSKYATHVKTLIQAGGNMREDIWLNLSQICDKTQAELFVMYGQAEATTRISSFSYTKNKNKLGSAGKVMDGGKLVISSEGNASEINEGEIIYFGRNVCPKYVLNDKDLMNIKDQKKNGLKTGDIGYLDDDGFLFITGRKKRFAKMKGVSFNLDELDKHVSDAVSVQIVSIQQDGTLGIFNTSPSKSAAILNFLKTKKFIDINKIKIFAIKKIPTLSNGKISYTQLSSLIKKEDQLP